MRRSAEEILQGGELFKVGRTGVRRSWKKKERGKKKEVEDRQDDSAKVRKESGTIRAAAAVDGCSFMKKEKQRGSWISKGTKKNRRTRKRMEGQQKEVLRKGGLFEVGRVDASREMRKRRRTRRRKKSAIRRIRRGRRKE